MEVVNMKNGRYKKPYKPGYMVSLARDLRRNATPAERKLWGVLRGNKFFGHHFRRQVPYGRYIFDFYCVKKKVAIEIDGAIHSKNKDYDACRDDGVSAAGITVLRFSNEDVLNNLQSVLECVKNHL